MRKRILFILPSLCVGGLERLQVTIANKLAEKDYKVTVITFDEGDELKDELNANVEFIYKKPKSFTLLRKIPYVRYKFFDSGLWETRASAKKLYKYYVGKNKYDVEIAFFRGRAVKIISGSQNRTSKKIAWVHSDFSKASGYTANFKSLDDAQKAYKSMDSIVCVSKQAAQGFKQVFGELDNINTIYNLLPVSSIIEKSKCIPDTIINRSEFHIVIVGRLLDNTKGQSRLINAVAKLRSEGFDISLTIVGSGSDKQMLKEHIHKCDATEYIKIIDGKNNPYPYIAQADLLVCASYFEGYNLTVAEAIVLGVPVLSTECAGPNEILDYGKYGMIVENSEQGLYSGLKKLASSPQLLNEYREKANARMGFFDEEKLIRQITALF